MTHHVDLFIIGAGPAGLAAAKQAAQYGVTVAIAEEQDLGGCCINRGCIPKKLMVYAADFAATLQAASDYQWDPCTSQFHWQKFREKRDQELQRLRQRQAQALHEAGVQVLPGHTQFLDAHSLEVAGQQYRASHILIAVGGKPLKPEIPGIEYTITSNELFTIEPLPERIAIIGGGYVGVEFASVLRGLGCDVTLMNREHCILEGFDDDVRSQVQAGLIQRGIHSLCHTTPEQITQTPTGLCLQLAGDGPEQIWVDQVLCAIGRSPNLDGLGLDTTGVEFDQNAIAVDAFGRTNQPHIFAVGDCTNRKQLTPVARTEGQIAVSTMFGKPAPSLDYHLVPSAVLSRPEASSVGLTETQARDQYGEAVQCYRKEFLPLKQSLTQQQQPALIKIIVDGNSDRILGIHMVGENAAEIVQSAAIALQSNVSRQVWWQTLGIHPSSAEELFSL